MGPGHQVHLYSAQLAPKGRFESIFALGQPGFSLQALTASSISLRGLKPAPSLEAARVCHSSLLSPPHLSNVLTTQDAAELGGVCTRNLAPPMEGNPTDFMRQFSDLTAMVIFYFQY